ncbi:mfs [Moniliophthora roreri MCA 2997]|uniref:Mfs n=1 Tax=Moniliophthora roreri (strain MCA 2997) TaxID=1381753 RepID=V2Y8I3_MONRO|nr:mfs [Moniliophthora roreri MCA 2997]
MSNDTRGSESRRLVRKIDLLLMPILTVSYGLQFYDKAVLGSASVFGIIEDLQLSTTVNGVTTTERYSTANAAFYYGYIVAVLPIALVLQRLPLIKTLSTMIFIWGLRVFLGIVESSVSPGFVLITSLWYTKEEQTSRVGFWYASTGIFSMFSGVVNYGLGHAGGPLATWKYMYFFAGAWTVVWAFVVLCFIPDSPNAPGRRFTEEEKILLKQRLASNMTGKDQTQWKWDQVIEAPRDLKLWIFMLCGAAIYVCNGGVTAFGARIIKSFGYSSLDSILLQIPGGAMTCVAIYIVGYLTGRFRDARTYILPLSCLPVMAGAIMIWKGSWVHKALPLWGYYLLPTFGAPYVMILGIAASNVAGGTKKAICNGMIFIGYNVGNIVGGYIVFADETPAHYRSTWVAIIVCMCFVIAASFVLRYIMARENQLRVSAAESFTEEAKDNDAQTEVESEQFDFQDLTDWQRKEFRYVL